MAKNSHNRVKKDRSGEREKENKGGKKVVMYPVILSRLVLMLFTSDINVIKGPETC